MKLSKKQQAALLTIVMTAGLSTATFGFILSNEPVRLNLITPTASLIDEDSPKIIVGETEITTKDFFYMAPFFLTILYGSFSMSQFIVSKRV